MVGSIGPASTAFRVLALARLRRINIKTWLDQHCNAEAYLPVLEPIPDATVLNAKVLAYALANALPGALACLGKNALQEAALRLGWTKAGFSP